MKNLVRLATSALLIAAIFGLAIPMSIRSTEASLMEPASKGAKDFKVKKGAEVAAKVRKFKESSENVRAALRYFDKKGKPSKIDDAFAITGSASSSKTTTASTNNSLIRPASFVKASSFASQDISEDNVELIFIPDYSVVGEWQGTIIANRYDDYGGLVEQYVAQSILVTPDPNSASWDEVYEAPVYGGEVQPPISEPGMYTDYNWGTTRDQQPTDYMMISKSGSHNRPEFVKAGFVQSRRARVRAWARCSFAWCGGAGLACVGVNIFDAELLAGPCFAVACGASMVGCTWGTLWQ
jgi:hypothetical protein